VHVRAAAGDAGNLSRTTHVPRLIWALLWLAGTLSWPRAAKIAGLAAAVAALAAMSVAAGHMVRVVGPSNPAHTTSVVSPQRTPAPAP
jgi:hypothetical protein